MTAEGKVYIGQNGRIRRIVRNYGGYVFYSRGGEKLYACLEETFRRFARNAHDVTMAEIELGDELWKA